MLSLPKHLYNLSNLFTVAIEMLAYGDLRFGKLSMTV